MGEENKVAPAPAAAPAPVEPAPAAPAPASGGGKSSNKVIIIIVIVIVVLGIIGYAAQKYLANKLAEKTAESILGGVTGTDVDVDSGENGGVTINSNGSSISTGSKSTWPATMPASVPEFTYGTITASSTSSDATYKSWSASFDSVDADALTKYSAAVLAKSWTQTYSADSDGSSSRLFDIAEYSMTFVVDSSNDNVIITVTAK